MVQQQHLIIGIRRVLQQRLDTALDLRQTILDHDKDTYRRLLGVPVNEVVAARQTTGHLRLFVSPRPQMALDYQALLGTVLQAVYVASQQGLADVPDACQALSLDQTQLIFQLEGMLERLEEATLLQERIAAEQPVAGQAGGGAEQQVEVQVRT
ncbi:hypothetical protein D3C81_1604290 [compost metagenome]